MSYIQFVLVVNYRLGIGYGRDFHRPPNAGAQGASEYTDVKATGKYLRTLPQVDPNRIGIYGGSYGGFLTALAPSHWRGIRSYSQPALTSTACTTGQPSAPNSFWRTATRSRPTPEQALDPLNIGVAVVLSLFDRDLEITGASHSRRRRSQRPLQPNNGLVRRLEKAGIPFESLVIPDDTHHFMRHANSVKVNAAVAAFFERVFSRTDMLNIRCRKESNGSNSLAKGRVWPKTNLLGITHTLKSTLQRVTGP